MTNLLEKWFSREGEVVPTFSEEAMCTSLEEEVCPSLVVGRATSIEHQLCPEKKESSLVRFVSLVGGTTWKLVVSQIHCVHQIKIP
jgi:hypothetical protein